MRKLLFLSMLGVSGMLGACNQTSKDDNSKSGASLFEINGTKGDPKSVYLWITDKVSQDSVVQFTVKGLYKKDTVGFLVLLNKEIAPGIRPDGTVDEVAGFQEGTVRFVKLGEESDRFVQALSEIWTLDSAITQFSNHAVVPLTFSSNKTAVNHDKPSTSNFKLFFNQDSADPGEVFFTVDTYQRNIEIQEKDRKFGKTIVHALGGLQ